MAGHSKWSQIKRKKSVEDSKRSRQFGGLTRAIVNVARLSGGDRNAPALRQAIERARAANLPAEKIERAVKQSPPPKNENDSMLYEAYGPGGTALLIECLTDNKNRTNQEIRRILNAHEGNLASPGGAVWVFQKLPGGEFKPKKPRFLDAEKKEKLNQLLAALRLHFDVKNIYTDASNGS